MKLKTVFSIPDDYEKNRIVRELKHIRQDMEIYYASLLKTGLMTKCQRNRRLETIDELIKEDRPVAKQEKLKI